MCNANRATHDRFYLFIYFFFVSLSSIYCAVHTRYALHSPMLCFSIDVCIYTEQTSTCVQHCGQHKFIEFKQYTKERRRRRREEKKNKKQHQSRVCISNIFVFFLCQVSLQMRRQRRRCCLSSALMLILYTHFYICRFVTDKNR